LEGKISDTDLKGLTQRLVGDDPNNCKAAQKKQYAKNGYTRGYDHDASKWLPVAGREALWDYTSLGARGFGDYLSHTGASIIRRVCPHCRYTHRNIFYKRITPLPQGFDLLEDLKYEKGGSEQTYGVDFELYSTYEDALAGANEWGCENYRKDKGFPGECNPEGGQTRDQESIFGSRSGQKQDVAYYVEKVPDPYTYISPTPVGDKSGQGTMYTSGDEVVASGSGWFSGGGSESFDFFALPHTGHVTIEGKITEYNYPVTNSRVGLMIRSGVDKDAPYFALSLGHDRRFEVMYRTSVGSNTQKKDRITLGSQVENLGGLWMKLEKRIDTFTAYTKSSDMGPWVVKYQSVVLNNMDDNDLQAGIFVSSGSGSRMADVVLTDYVNEAHFFPSATPTASPAPSMKGEEAFDVGTGNFDVYPGETTYTNSLGRWRLQGSGKDIWNSRDGFHMAVLGRMSGPITMTAFVEELVGEDQWTKVGIMLRDHADLVQDGREKNVFVGLTQRHGVQMQFRNQTSSRSYEARRADRNSRWTSAWIKLVMDGNTFTGYRKQLAEEEWDYIADCTVDFDTPTVLVGLATTSHDNNAYAEGFYTDVQVSNTIA